MRWRQSRDGEGGREGEGGDDGVGDGGGEEEQMERIGAERAPVAFDSLSLRGQGCVGFMEAIAMEAIVRW